MMEDSSDIGNNTDSVLSSNPSPLRTDKMAAGVSTSRCSTLSANVEVVKSKKTKKPSKSATMQAEFDEKLKTMESGFNSKFDQLFELILQNQNRGSEPPRSDSLGNSVGNGPLGTRRPQNNEDNDPAGVRRPIISLEPNLDQDLGSPRISRNRDFDTRSEISLHVGNDERHEFDIRSDPESNGAGEESDIEQERVISTNDLNNDNRFVKHVQATCSSVSKESNATVKNVSLLGQIFKEDCSKQKSIEGLVLDQAQIDILDSTWRSKHPDRISAYKEEYKNCFPIHDDSVDFLKVPTLDDIFEIMLRQTHGQKAVQSWDSHRQLHTQPFKQIEKLGYQGQLSARMNIISTLYMQQALGSLAQSVEKGEFTPESLLESLKDIFAMSAKSLDQAGRSGAFFHMIRRKATAQDSGLVNLKEIKSKCQYFPLTGDGLFGDALETCLEKRKEQKEQLSELLPEFTPQTKKRKIESTETTSNKVAKGGYGQNVKSGNNYKASYNNSYNASSGYNNNNNRKTSGQGQKQKTALKNANTDNKKDGNKGNTKSSWGSFRVPKRSDS